MDMRDLDAIQSREFEQQQLLEKIRQDVFDFEEESNQKEVAVGLILAAVAYLKSHGSEKVEGQVLAFDFIPCLRLFAAKVQKPVMKFSDNEEERLVLIAMFLEW